MGEFIGWGVLAAFAFYTALRGPKDAPFFRLLLAWYGLSLAIFAVLDLRGSHPRWLKWPFIAVLILIGAISFARNELWQRTRYTTMLSQLRSNITHIFNR